MTEISPEKAQAPANQAEGRRTRIPGAVIIIIIPFFAVMVFILGLSLMARYTEMKVTKGVAQARADMRVLATAIETYYVDNMQYPAMAKSRDWAAGAYVLPPEVPVTRTFRMRHNSGLNTLTTPIGYLANYPADPFREFKGTTYSYYTDGRGWILGSWGPNMNQSLGGDLQWHLGPLDPDLDSSRNPLPGQGIASAYNSRIAQPSDELLAGNHNQHGVGAYTYDPTNGLFSHGDLWRIKQ